MEGFINNVRLNDYFWMGLMTSYELAKIDNLIFFIMQSCEVPDSEKCSHIKIRTMFRTKNSNIKT